jgi:hypothetical protein
MRQDSAGRYIPFGVALLILSGCSNAITPSLRNSGSLIQGATQPLPSERSARWMPAPARGQDLLYVSNEAGTDLFVFTLRGKQAGRVKLAGGSPAGLCSAPSGNFFVVVEANASQSYIYEFPHGGTTPIATFNNNGLGVSCSVDPTTGNLAVTNLTAPGSKYGNVAIFSSPSKSPKTYSDPNVGGYWFCAYDASGNLFADGYSPNLLNELSKGSVALSEIALTQEINPASLQWYGSKLIVSDADPNARHRGEQQIYRVKISGSKGLVSGPTLLSSKDDRQPGYAQFVVEGSKIIGPGWTNGASTLLEFWNYPQGGTPTRVVKPGGHRGIAIFGMTISVP